jgi:recombinase
VVTEIFRIRALERLGYRQIAERLNQDLIKYPPPVANHPDATVGSWTVQAICGILANPKYTGYQVWNRKARKRVPDGTVGYLAVKTPPRTPGYWNDPVPCTACPWRRC